MVKIAQSILLQLVHLPNIHSTTGLNIIYNYITLRSSPLAVEGP